MTISEDFRRAWYEWTHVPEPNRNLHYGYTGSPSYGIEKDLDRLADFVYWLGGNALREIDSDYRGLASRGLTETERIGSELEKSELSDDLKKEIREYLFITATLLEEIRKLSSDDEYGL